MTDVNENDLPLEDELTSLKARANLMGIKYHPNIGVDALKERIAAVAAPVTDVPTASVVPLVSARQAANQRLKAAQEEALKLVRVQITCMNPAKKEYRGEIFAVGNRGLGIIKKFIQFEVPYHVPHIILTEMEDRKYQTFSTTRDARGNKITSGRLVKEYAINYLPALSEQELKELAQRQAMAAGTAA